MRINFHIFHVRPSAHGKQNLTTHTNPCIKLLDGANRRTHTLTLMQSFHMAALLRLCFCRFPVKNERNMVNFMVFGFYFEIILLRRDL